MDIMMRRLPAGLVSALCLLSSPALAGAAEDCRNPDIERAERIAPCTAAIKAATDPVDRADLLLYRGAHYNAQQDYERAEADYVAAQALRPDWADPHVERAYSLLDQGDAKAAIAEAQRGLEVEPTSTLAAVQIMTLMADAGSSCTPRTHSDVPSRPTSCRTTIGAPATSWSTPRG